MSRQLSMVVFAGAMLIAMANVVYAQAPVAASAQTRAAQWEREASTWAMQEIDRALAADKDKAAKLAEGFARTPGVLPAEIKPVNSIVLFSRPISQPIGRRNVPAAADVTTGLTVTLAAEEWETAQLGLFATAALKNVQVKIDSLTHANGQARIAGDDLRCFFLTTLIVPVKEKGAPAPADGDVVVGAGPDKALGFREYPSALLDLPAVDVPAQQTQAIWIDIHAAKDAVPGEYQGKIILSADGKELARLPLKVKVRPFILDWVKSWGRGAFASKFLDRQQLIQGREHGLNQVSWWTSGGSSVKLVDGKIVSDYSPFQAYLKLLDEVGYDGPHAVFIGGSDPKLANRIAELLGRSPVSDARNVKSGQAFKDFDFSPPFGDYLVQAMKQFHEQMKAVGHADLTACLLDEPDHEPRPQRRDFYLKMFEMVEKGAPEVPLYGTFYHAGDEDRLSHHHRVWTTNRPAKKIADICKKAGQKLFTYGFDYGYQTPPNVVRFRFGILPWVYHADGSFFWAQYWHKGNPFNPFEISNTDTASLPTPHGPLATPMLKGIREAVDDYRYLATLEGLIAQAMASGSPAAREQAQQHQKWLDSFRLPLYDKMEVTAGRPKFAAVGKLTIQGLDGTSITLEDPETNTWVFADFVRQDASQRIEALSKAIKQ